MLHVEAFPRSQARVRPPSGAPHLFALSEWPSGWLRRAGLNTSLKGRDHAAIGFRELTDAEADEPLDCYLSQRAQWPEA